jgi:hypothetical protein
MFKNNNLCTIAFAVIMCQTIFMSTKSLGQPCDSQGSSVSLQFYFWIGEDLVGCPEQEYASSFAWRSCQGFCGSDIRLDADADVDYANPPETDTTSAGAGSAECLPGMIGSGASTRPPCSDPFGDPQIYTNLQAGFAIGMCPGQPACYRSLSSSANGRLVVDRPVESYAILIMINSGSFLAADAPLGSGSVRWGINGDFDGSNILLVGGTESLAGTRFHGAVQPVPPDEFINIDNTYGLGDFSGSLSFNAVNDQSVDFNGDGRFNEADVALAQSYVGNSWPTSGYPSYLQFDDDGDGIADQSEVNRFEDLLNSGLDAGIFGDLNGNGVVNCVDFGLVPAGAFAAELGDAAYRIQLDQDLDGEVTATEQREFYKRVEHPDFNLDGFVDFFDYDDFTAAYQAGTDMSADWNYDGFIDFFDFDDFSAQFQSGGC